MSAEENSAIVAGSAIADIKLCAFAEMASARLSSIILFVDSAQRTHIESKAEAFLSYAFAQSICTIRFRQVSTTTGSNANTPTLSAHTVSAILFVFFFSFRFVLLLGLQ